MGGYDDLARGLAGIDDLGCDDPRVQQALQAAIDSGDLEDEDLATACSALGHCYHWIGRQHEARELLERGISLSKVPGQLAMMHSALGETLFVLERHSEAEPHYRAALQLDRQHSRAPETLLQLGRTVYLRSDGRPDLLDESHGCFFEALALLEAPGGEEYSTSEAREKSLFSAVFGMGICKSDMPTDKERYQAVELFERAEQLALDNRERISNNELKNVYLSWIRLLAHIGLQREAELVAERAARNLE